MAAEATEEERAAVDGLLGPPETGWEGGDRVDGQTYRVARTGREAREQRHLLLPALHSVQSRVGWISDGALNYVSQRLSVPPAEAYGVASFYALFSTKPRPRTMVHVCDDIACRVSGAKELCAEMDRADLGEDAAWLPSPCLGRCDAAPAALLQ